jgi:tRNA modification GTPase
MTQAETIAAIATPPGRGGIGIIKVSGPRSIQIAETIFRRKADGNGSKPAPAGKLKSYRLYYGRVVVPGRGITLDEVLLAVMKAPHSYTREDVVEIQGHAGPAALKSILSLILQQGARLADPGEFTRRAFLNGRIDLTQAEAVADIINARTDAALLVAANQVSGKLSAVIAGLKKALVETLADIEAEIDFPEDAEGAFDRQRASHDLTRRVAAPVEKLIEQYAREHLIRDGLRIIIVGRPNVGKSSLLNCLVNKDRAIVTDTPGTTRDFIEEELQIHGIPVTAIDTAGLHRTDDPIEKAGIARAEERIEHADLVLFVLDAGEPLTAEDFSIHSRIAQKNRIVVLNKIDLLNAGTVGDGLLPDDWQKMPFAAVSALTKQGLEDLKVQIVQTAAGDIGGRAEHAVIPNLRHEMALRGCLQALHAVLAGIQNDLPAELIAIDLGESIRWLDRITGTDPSPDILDQIFNQFCIGK